MTLGRARTAIDRRASQVSRSRTASASRGSMLRTIALALGTTADELLKPDARRSGVALEIASSGPAGRCSPALGSTPFPVCEDR
jgi:hypothetical protein